jgi:glycosyltransferase involved in cell wall biosynthesis
VNIIILAGSVQRTQAGGAHAAVELANRMARVPSIQTYLYTSDFERGTLDPAIKIVRYEPPRRMRVLWRFKHLAAVAHHAAEMRRHPLPPMDMCYSTNIVLPLAFRRVHPHTHVVSHTGAVLTKRERQEELHGKYQWCTAVDANLVDRIERKTYRQPNWDHVVSTNLVAREREKYFGLPHGFFKICPLGVSVERFGRGARYPDMRAAHNIPKSATVLVTVARLVQWKNIQLVLRALAKCRRKDVYLFVVGDGDQREPLARLARLLDVEDRVRFVGHSQEPAAFYAASDIFVLPSLIESFGLVYAEAMLMGLPCIGMRNNPPAVLSSSEDVIMHGRTGYVISDVDEMVQKLDTLIEDEQLRREMGRNGYELARARYSGEHYMEFVLSLAQSQAERQSLATGAA